jgi:hypothetical protein
MCNLAEVKVYILLLPRIKILSTFSIDYYSDKYLDNIKICSNFVIVYIL